jgi:DNA-binding MarR family transcriptional regulator
MTERTHDDLHGDLIEEIGDLQRRISTVTVVMHQLIAEKLGLGPSDHKSLDLARTGASDEPITAGRLAELTGLTTGAITGILDRLERAGFIRREKDPNDRRQVRVRIVPERAAEMGRAFEPLNRSFQKMCARYSAEELEVVSRFSRDTLQLATDLIERMKAAPAVPKGPSAPLGDARRGELVFTRGVDRVAIGDTSEAVLFRADFEGKPPTIRVDGGTVHLQGARGNIALANAVPWGLRVRGGARRLDADLRRLEVDSIEISGGSVHVELLLPAPRGTVPVRLTGGASHVTIVRPAGAPARLLVRSGASGLTIETLRLGDVGGATHWSTPDFDRARDRYDIEVSGGADTLTVGIDTDPSLQRRHGET